MVQTSVQLEFGCEKEIPFVAMWRTHWDGRRLCGEQVGVGGGRQNLGSDLQNVVQDPW